MLREIWSLNKDIKAYNNIFYEIFSVIQKAVYHQGYIGPDFPLSFEKDIKSSEIPNYLIVNEL